MSVVCRYFCRYLGYPNKRDTDSIPMREIMALTDTFVKQTKEVGKHFDGEGIYLHVKSAGKYWRLAYRFADKAKTRLVSNFI